MHKIVKQTAAVLLACTMMSGIVPANVTSGIFSTSISASALTGNGTMVNPYVVNSYDELHELISSSNECKHMFEYEKHLYVKLGSDIIENDSADDRYFNIYTHHEYYKETVHLDLAGHKLSRVASTNDNCFLSIDYGSVIIDDSVGGGIISCDYNDTDTSLFKVTDFGTLIINGGTFELLTNNKNDSCIINSSGYVIINGGTFKSYRNLLTTDHKDLGISKINNGTFIYKGEPDISDKPNYGIETDRIKNCTVIGERSDVFIYSREENPNDIKGIIPEQAVVTINGEVVAHDDLCTDNPSIEYKRSMISGKEINISSPEEVKAVNMSITAPDSGANPDHTAVVTGDGFTEYTKRTKTVNDRNRIVNAYNTVDWYHGDILMRTRDKFKEGETYTAKFYLRSDDTHMLSEDTKVFVNDVEAATTAKDFSGAVLYTVEFVCEADLVEPEDLGELVIDLTNKGKMDYDYYPYGLFSMGKRALIGYDYEEDYDWFDLDNDGNTDVCYSVLEYLFTPYIEPEKNEIIVTLDEEAIKIERDSARRYHKSGYYSSMRFIFQKKSVYTIGDINSDGIINITDISKAAAHVKGKKRLSDDALIRADVNSDGIVNISDITKIAAHVKGKKLLIGKK
ncbi:MAG: hypothetical protein E7494_08500 [Ruminococcus albus]|jgi:hypothetical protein|nr:hypothetical protein [Ruminococcus albus]